MTPLSLPPSINKQITTKWQMLDPSAMAFAVRGGGCTVTSSSIMLSRIRLPSPDMIIEGKRKGKP